MDRRGIFHPNTDLRAYAHGELGDPHIIRAAKGIHIHDQHGNEFIDAFAGLWCVNVGYGRTEIADAMHEQAKRRSGCGRSSDSENADWLAVRTVCSEPVSRILAGNFPV